MIGGPIKPALHVVLKERLIAPQASERSGPFPCHLREFSVASQCHGVADLARCRHEVPERDAPSERREIPLDLGGTTSPPRKVGDTNKRQPEAIEEFRVDYGDVDVARF